MSNKIESSGKKGGKLPFRIGHGYDVHRFGDTENEANQITLGGVCIPHNRALLAHSDGDVLIHALCDALLGAIGAGDIGQHFPDNETQFKNIDSCILLEKVIDSVRQAGYFVANTDITIIAQAPKLSPHKQAMRERLSPLLNVELEQINIKATTTEQLGFTGREEGIAVHAIVMIYAAPQTNNVK